MASPLAKLRQEALAKQQKKSTPEKQFVANPNSLHLLLSELESDLKVLKTFNRTDEKVNHKREVLVPKYRQAIEEYLAGDEQFDNPLFTQMVIWLFDIEDLETAIEWCDIAIERGLDTPERFKRDFATFCADEVLKWSERMASYGHSIEPYFNHVFANLTPDENGEKPKWAITEKLSAKWFKFAGLYLLRNEKGEVHAGSVGDTETLEKAKNFLLKAQDEYPAIGVKTMIDKIEQRIRALESGDNL
ncbi:phage terminase small subunit [Vibrio kanaloae]|uniref:phage terminase small subunit n=1 Tax=Vibrio kanaloae TaxID=170673 RepID=UPI001EFD12CA|nr:phage terminase small subunit [Vibrio kanaloae]MCG9557900.1 phage terminase small subunit [Vibrio kanaloae]